MIWNLRKISFMNLEWSIARSIQIRDAYLRAGRNHSKAGRELGISRAGVHLSIKKYFPELLITKQERAIVYQRELLLAELTRRLIAARPCCVCGSWVLRGEGYRITCSSECAIDWGIIRYHLDSEQRHSHQILIANWLLRNSTDPIKLRYARRFISGESKFVGRWVLSPRVAAILKKHGHPVAKFTEDTVHAKD